MVANAGIIIPKAMMDFDLAEFNQILNVSEIVESSKERLCDQ